MCAEEESRGSCRFTVFVQLTRDHHSPTIGTTAKLVTQVSGANLEIAFDQLDILKASFQMVR